MKNAWQKEEWYLQYQKEYCHVDQVFPWYKEQFSLFLESFDPDRAHAILISGPTFSGLFQFSHCLSLSLLCEDRSSLSRCGVCSSCRWALSQTHPDYRLIYSEPRLMECIPPNASFFSSAEHRGSAQSISIDAIRELSHFFSLSTHRGRRIALICPVEAMSDNAAQALLKTLEEPLSNTIFLLMTYQPHQLKPTLMSRCQWRIQLPFADPQVVQQWLKTSNLPLMNDKAMGVRRPLMYVVLGVTKTQLSLQEFMTKLISKRIDFFELTSLGMAIIKSWGEFIGPLPALSLFLHVLLETLHLYLIKNYTNMDNKVAFLKWVLFYDFVREALSSLTPSLNHQLLLERIVASHPSLNLSGKMVSL